MNIQTLKRFLTGSFILGCAVLGFMDISSQAQQGWDGTIMQYGAMHEAIGKQEHHGRIPLNEIANRPHFYGVAALERLRGEVTVFDSNVTITGVSDDGTLQPMSDLKLQATLLVGAYVPTWTECKIETSIPPVVFEDCIRDAATKAGYDISRPFPFTVEGEFSELRFHVINGACPIHARIKSLQLRSEVKPFEAEYPDLRGRLVGIYAKDAVGKLTHPATSTHVHVVFWDERSGGMVTGHVERVGLAKGAVLKLPQKGIPIPKQ